MLNHTETGPPGRKRESRPAGNQAAFLKLSNINGNAQPYKPGDPPAQVAFLHARRARELCQLVEDHAAALGNALAALAIMRGSCDGSACLGPIGLRAGLELIAHIRPRR